MPSFLPHARIRTHLLLIALVPALLTEIGLVGYFVNQNIRTAEREQSARAANAARHLSSTLPYALVSGNEALMQKILKTEHRDSQLMYAVVTDAHNTQLAIWGDVEAAARAATADPAGRIATGIMRVRAPILMPTADAGPIRLSENLVVPAPPTALGEVEIGVDLRQIAAYKRSTLLKAALLVMIALVLTGILAWRLSNRLAGQLLVIGAAVGRIARGDLQVRADIPAHGEIGTLAAGVNHMAEVLQAHQAELEVRICHATADLAAKKDEAERANIVKSRFFAAASHDLRQPMHALSLFVAALKMRSQAADIQSLVDNIEASTAAMELLFNALLDISKLDASVIEVDTQHFPVQMLLDKLHAQFSAVALEKNLKLRVRPCQAIAHSDPLLLERILANLVSNAIRYTERGGILVACRMRGSEVQLTVYDSGYGIPEKQQQNIFQEFVQLHNPERDRTQGLGLGLAIVSRLGRLLGHRIGLQSRPGRGSCFTINVPLGNPRLMRKAPLAANPGMAIEGALVVLIDDEEAILQAMSELFDNWKLDLIAVKSVNEALHVLKRIRKVPDVIVSDYRLPHDTDGLKVIRQLRTHFQEEIPAVLVTGDTAPETILRISQAGFPILHKPLRPAKLRALLTHLIQQARAEHAASMG